MPNAICATHPFIPALSLGPPSRVSDLFFLYDTIAQFSELSDKPRPGPGPCLHLPMLLSLLVLYCCYSIQENPDLFPQICHFGLLEVVESSLRSTEPNTSGQTSGLKLSVWEDPSQAIPLGTEHSPAQPSTFHSLLPSGSSHLSAAFPGRDSRPAWLLLLLSAPCPGS